MTDDELAAASEALEELRAEVRPDFADDLGGDPEDVKILRATSAILMAIPAKPCLTVANKPLQTAVPTAISG